MPDPAARRGFVLVPFSSASSGSRNNYYSPKWGHAWGNAAIFAFMVSSLRGYLALFYTWIPWLLQFHELVVWVAGSIISYILVRWITTYHSFGTILGLIARLPVLVVLLYNAYTFGLWYGMFENWPERSAIIEYCLAKLALLGL